MIPLVLAAAMQFAPGAPDLVFAPITAVDHIVIMQVDRGPRDRYQEVIARVGDRFRAERIGERGINVTYSNVKSRVSVLTYTNGGRPISLAARRETDLPWSRYGVTNTGEQDRLLGETCTVWERVSMASPGNRGPRYRHCLTADGIELWWRVYYTSGKLMGFGAATSVQRRSLTDSEMRPPAEMFDWAAWQRHYPPPAETAPNYDVDLGTLTLRHHGQASFYEKRSTTYHQLSISTGAVSLMFSGDQNGPRVLSVSRASPRSAANVQPLDLGETATVLDETCRWWNLEPNIADGGTHECRTNDNIPLRRREITWGHSTNFVATRLTRGAVTSADIQPPASVFDWNY